MKSHSFSNHHQIAHKSLQCSIQHYSIDDPIVSRMQSKAGYAPKTNGYSSDPSPTHATFCPEEYSVPSSRYLLLVHRETKLLFLCSIHRRLQVAHALPKTSIHIGLILRDEIFRRRTGRDIWGLKETRVVVAWGFRLLRSASVLKEWVEMVHTAW